MTHIDYRYWPFFALYKNYSPSHIHMHVGSVEISYKALIKSSKYLEFAIRPTQLFLLHKCLHPLLDIPFPPSGSKLYEQSASLFRATSFSTLYYSLATGNQGLKAIRRNGLSKPHSFYNYFSRTAFDNVVDECLVLILARRNN